MMPEKSRIPKSIRDVDLGFGSAKTKQSMP